MNLDSVASGGPLAVNMPPTKVSLQCKTAVHVIWKTCECCDHIQTKSRPCWKNYTRNMHVSCMFLQISCVLHHACFMHVPHTMYMHVSCPMHGTCMEHVRNWDVFHACYMHEPCILHEWHSCHEWTMQCHECTMHEPCMHGLAGCWKSILLCSSFLYRSLYVRSTSWKLY